MRGSVQTHMHVSIQMHSRCTTAHRVGREEALGYGPARAQGCPPRRDLLVLERWHVVLVLCGQVACCEGRRWVPALFLSNFGDRVSHSQVHLVTEPCNPAPSVQQADLAARKATMAAWHRAFAQRNPQTQLKQGVQQRRLDRLTRRLASSRASACHSRNSAMAGCVAYVKRPATFIVSWLPANQQS